MRLAHDSHLAYCTNIHRGEDWKETFAGLERYTLEVRQQVCPADSPYAIGLRLSAKAAKELSDPTTLLQFQRWLEKHNCYVFTINGFPYGSFHDTRVKEQVYAPDWQTTERLHYTNQLFEILAQLLPSGVSGSVSTVPCSFKDFIDNSAQVDAIRKNLISCVDHIAKLSERHGCDLHLGLEPEPLGFLETTEEALNFFETIHRAAPNSDLIRQHLGINYDTCHMAIQYEEPRVSLNLLRAHDIRLSKLHLSSALKVKPTPTVQTRLADFIDTVYLHQVVARSSDGNLTRYTDLDQALDSARDQTEADEEWRIHFHVPLHTKPDGELRTTKDHLLGVLDALAEDPSMCSHLEFETYTWEVLPAAMKTPNVVSQLTAEYDWCLNALAERGLNQYSIPE
ncbi:metabolite traffic protein EboE [Rubellicoccus peritrichatus]|uniref:Metabolite traffic protein EboE n=1 Tax=Rubellicoccus peritrichatus TaxID=3080537 RepID=A0AAQ3QTM7_9BACT|nr:metabolite traffic protein EboE [Puniceicoccus sp. CR14]WOO41491.1 metabolite traffic protein EboE [Puniceicoccus sp. CR14]